MSVETIGTTPERFLTEAECAALQQRVEGMATGGGDTSLALDSTWTGNLRWARNRITTTGDVRNNEITLRRMIRGAHGDVRIDMLDDAALADAVKRAEHFLKVDQEKEESVLTDGYVEPALSPKLFFDTTFNLDAAQRAKVMHGLVQPAMQAGMLSAGYIEVSATGRTVRNSRGLARYFAYTQAQYSVTVRDPQGTASGWAGGDWGDWSRIDTAKITASALQKCLDSRHPVAIEPGRYTTILEPQAVGDLFSPVMQSLDRLAAEVAIPPFNGPTHGTTKIGTQVFDSRITITADPMDPDLGFPAFDLNNDVYHPVHWVDQGILTNLAYDRNYGVTTLRLNSGLPTNRAFRMSGGTSTVEEMISTTKRGLLVTRFSNITLIDPYSLLYSGYTRDGLWLIENGEISKPVKNFYFTESPMFVFNSVEDLGIPVRIFSPGTPVVVPPVKVHDFSFTGLADAV